MSGIAIALLFSTTFALAAWVLIESVRPQLHRFAALTRPLPELPALPPRLQRVTVRAMPARLPQPVRAPRRAAA